MKGSEKIQRDLLKCIPALKIEVYQEKGRRHWIAPNKEMGIILLLWGVNQPFSGPEILTATSKKFHKIPPVWQIYCHKFWDAYQKLNYGL